MKSLMTYSVCINCNGVNRVPTDLPNGKSPICGKCKTPLNLHNGVTELNGTNFETLVAKSPIPVVVDFWAPWCAPCRVFAPTFNKAAQALNTQAVFVKIDTQAFPETGQKFAVKGIPTLMIFIKGNEIGRISGAMAFDDLTKWIVDTTRING